MHLVPGPAGQGLQNSSSMWNTNKAQRSHVPDSSLLPVPGLQSALLCSHISIHKHQGHKQSGGGRCRPEGQDSAGFKEIADGYNGFWLLSVNPTKLEAIKVPHPESQASEVLSHNTG